MTTHPVPNRDRMTGGPELVLYLFATKEEAFTKRIEFENF
jgi:hypothetical protein